MNYQNIFVRKEKKYLLSEDEFRLVSHYIRQYMQPDKHYISHIHNLYFDTAEDSLVLQSLEGNNYKYKVRLRSYGADSPDGSAFLEIKSKLKGVVYKRRVRLSREDYKKYLAGGKIDSSSQVVKEINYLFDRFNLYPKIFIAYDRISFKAENPDLRITFDTNLRSRLDNLDIEKNDGCENHFAENTHIMEIKTRDSMPQWLTNFLAANKIYPTSFSKYGKIFLKSNQRSTVYA